MIGILLLEGRAGLETSSAGFVSTTSDSARFNVVYFDDGGGLAPDGRGGRALRRSARYCAICSSDMDVGRGVGLSLLFSILLARVAVGSRWNVRYARTVKGKY